MSGRWPRIHWVAPPFAGHLFPMLRIAEGLRRAGVTGQRVHTTPCMEPAVRGAGLEFEPVLAAREAAILEVAGTGGSRIGGNPLRLLGQFRETLGFLGELGEVLDAEWRADPPDLVIADSVLPSAGLAARRAGARWWTSMASVSPTETRRGTPSYLGGWRSRPGPLFGLRDAAGRAAVRGFKGLVGRLCRRELEALGVSSVYRADGTEACYSDDVILGLASEAFEFPRDWPRAMRFVGYPVGTAIGEDRALAVDPDHPHLLVTLGTHLAWARSTALAHAMDLARRLPDWRVHLSHGDPAGTLLRSRGNLTEASWVPYGASLGDYAAVCHHGGAGITYAALAAGVPALVWPRDFDQFDNAARLVACGAGLRARGRAAANARALQRLVGDPSFAEAARSMGARMGATDPVSEVLGLLAREGLRA